MHFGKILIILTLSTFSCFSSSIEELLAPDTKNIKTSDSQADEAWKGVVNAFHKNDMATAALLGRAFLTGDLKPSAYQLLGVQVMLGLADETTGSTVFENVENQQLRKKLNEERTNITKKYQELTTIYQEADARINHLTVNRTKPVREGSSQYLECLRCLNIMEEAKAELGTLNTPIEANKKAMDSLKSKADGSMKPQTMELLDMLMEAHETEAAFAIANTYIRKIGNDFDIAKKQQAIVRLNEISEKATKVVALLQADIDSLSLRKHYWEAKAKASQFSARVMEVNNEKDLHEIIQAKIDITMRPINLQIEEAAKISTQIKALADIDFANAYQKFELFSAEYPDCPDRLDLEVVITSAKAKSLDKILARMVQNFEDLQGRFDPERLSAFVSKSSVGLQKESTIFTSKENLLVKEGTALVELGVAPADTRLVQSQLQGLSAALLMLEKLGTPPDRMIQITEIKTTVVALNNLLK